MITPQEKASKEFSENPFYKASDPIQGVLAGIKSVETLTEDKEGATSQQITWTALEIKVQESNEIFRELFPGVILSDSIGHNITFQKRNANGKGLDSLSKPNLKTVAEYDWLIVDKHLDRTYTATISHKYN